MTDDSRLTTKTLVVAQHEPQAVSHQSSAVTLL